MHLLSVGQVSLIEWIHTDKLKAFSDNIEWFIEGLGHHGHLVGSNLHQKIWSQKVYMYVWPLHVGESFQSIMRLDTHTDNLSLPY